ncbi:hypothetical protein [Streptomyces sp. NPDC086777]|uniref:hypothetical protein n=1 Tax=Streptomyces sp. NPDC086777 TaxID=3154866 RepID=UPI00344F5D5F
MEKAGETTRLRKWSVRTLWTVLAVPASALVTAGSFGIAYGVAGTPDWWSSLLIFVGVVVATGCLIGLVGLLLHPHREFGKLDVVAAVCVALTTAMFTYTLEQQALHDRGRVEKAVVTSVDYSDGAGGLSDGGPVARLADLSGHRLVGTVGAGGLAAGDRLTVTVDPEGRFAVHRGPRPGTPRLEWEATALVAAFQALISSVIGFSTAVQNEWYWRIRRRNATRDSAGGAQGDGRTSSSPGGPGVTGRCRRS